jgi:hypothetical protein
MRLTLGEPLRVDALRTDTYIESLISGVEVEAGPESAGRPSVAMPGETGGPPDAVATAAEDDDVARVARLLHATAWRPHPSFRFEERVAGRLVAVARGRLSADDRAAGTLVAFPMVAAGALPAVRAGVPLAGIASAAIASAALSIGAAAVVAWRRGRPRRGVA